MTFEAVAGAPLGPKFPGALAETDLDELVALALALLSYKPQRPWFRRLYIERRLALHSRSGLLKQADAEALAHLAAHPAIRWSFAHGDITARNVLRDTKGETALIDWEWAGLYPAGYDLAFLWFSLIGVPGGRAKVEAAVPRHHEVGFLLSATLVQLLHLQLWLHTPHPYMPRHEQTLRELLAVVRSGDGAAQGPALRGPG
jgi:Ser/Thr protein kinase RdoA (MazF antagonist)